VCVYKCLACLGQTSGYNSSYCPGEGGGTPIVLRLFHPRPVLTPHLHLSCSRRSAAPTVWGWPIHTALRCKINCTWEKAKILISVPDQYCTFFSQETQLQLSNLIQPFISPPENLTFQNFGQNLGLATLLHPPSTVGLYPSIHTLYLPPVLRDSLTKSRLYILGPIRLKQHYWRTAYRIFSFFTL
jgi:hypothetical protein